MSSTKADTARYSHEILTSGSRLMMRPQEDRISENANAIRIAMTTESNSNSEIVASPPRCLTDRLLSCVARRRARYTNNG